MSWLSNLNPFASASTTSDQSETRHRAASRMVRSLASFVPGLGDAPADFSSSEQRTLRVRSRDSYRNQPIARGVVNRVRNSAVGTGLMCHPAVDRKALGITKERAKELNELLSNKFTAWADSAKDCDICGVEDFYALQGIALVSSMCSGDVLILTPFDKRGDGLGLKLQLIEADRICNPTGQMNSSKLIDGVVLGPGGFHKGYWVANKHPGSALSDVDMESTFYATFDDTTGRRRAMLVSEERSRPGEVRTPPFLSALIEPLAKLDTWSRAALAKAVVGAMITTFLEKEAAREDGAGNPLGPLGEEIFDDPVDQPPIDLGEGAVVDLEPGTKANQQSPNKTDPQFDPFFKSYMKQIGAAANIPESEILLAYEESYSAARAAMLQAWRYYESRRWRLSQQSCQPTYELAVDELVASGEVDLPDFAKFRRAYTRCVWIGPPRGAMDEDKELKAAVGRVRAGFSTEAREAEKMTGEDATSIREERSAEVEQNKLDGTFADRHPAAAEAERAIKVAEQVATKETP